jgi:hypothetical protein
MTDATTTIRTERPARGQTTYHRDGTVTVWDLYAQCWVWGIPGPRLLASLSEPERGRIRAHCADFDALFLDDDDDHYDYDHVIQTHGAER